MANTAAPAPLAAIDGKALAAQVRTAIRTATRTPGDALDGLAVSVRYSTASMCQTITIRVTGIDVTDLYVTTEHPQRGWTAAARALSDRLHALAADACDWDNGLTRFTEITLGGAAAPAPRTAEDVLDAEYERRNLEERAELDADPAFCGTLTLVR